MSHRAWVRYREPMPRFPRAGEPPEIQWVVLPWSDVPLHFFAVGCAHFPRAVCPGCVDVWDRCYDIEMDGPVMDLFEFYASRNGG